MEAPKDSSHAKNMVSSESSRPIDALGISDGPGQAGHVAHESVLHAKNFTFFSSLGAWLAWYDMQRDGMKRVGPCQNSKGDAGKN